MGLAIERAREAERHGDVPIGAVIARDGEPLAAAGNERELRGDPTAHAEILAIRAAAEALGGWRLPGTTLYVTLEPCAMCAGAIVLARIPEVVFGAPDPKAGAAGSVLDVLAEPALNHRPKVTGGVLGGRVRRPAHRLLLRAALSAIPLAVPERCPSGLRSATGNRVGGVNPPRGFESHPLRSGEGHAPPGPPSRRISPRTKPRRGAGAVERGSLENCWRRKALVGSNPTPSAS